MTVMMAIKCPGWTNGGTSGVNLGGSHRMWGHQFMGAGCTKTRNRGSIYVLHYIMAVRAFVVAKYGFYHSSCHNFTPWMIKFGQSISFMKFSVVKHPIFVHLWGTTMLEPYNRTWCFCIKDWLLLFSGLPFWYNYFSFISKSTND